MTRVLLFALLTLAPSIANAHVRSLEIDPEPRRDGWLRLTETVAYDFERTPGVYIERQLVRRSPSGDTDGRLLQLREVTDTAVTALEFTTVDTGESLHLYIGDDTRKTGGTDTVRIVYDLADATLVASMGEDLVFEAVSDTWRVPIDALTVRLNAAIPDAVAVLCPTVRGGSETGACELERSGDTLILHAASLDPSESLVLSLTDPTGTVARSWGPLRLFDWLADQTGY